MTNKKIIESFYTAFQNEDSKTMNSFLSEEINFEDPAFGKLKGDDVRFMWQFLTENSKDFSMTFSNIEANEKTGSAFWEAHYTIGATGNKVHNKIHSIFTFKEGKIVNHKDDFDLQKWVKQAFGSTIGLFGGSSFMRKTVQKKSNALLSKYQNKNSLL